MSELYIAFAVIGAAVLLLALVSRPIEETPLSPPLLLMLIGVAIGPEGFDLLDPSRWGDPFLIMEEAATVTLAISVMGIALRLPRGFVIREYRVLIALLGFAMPLMWLSTSLLTHLILGIPLLVALVIGAAVTPTDPVVASAIVTGRVARTNLPKRVRHGISAESGANDGLAYPYVILPIFLLTGTDDAVFGDWLLHIVLLEVGGGILIGFVLGLLAGYALHKAEEIIQLEKSSFLAYTLALTLLVLGVAYLLNVNELIAVFFAGLAFDQMVGARERAEEENVQETVNSFFTLPAFGLFGLMLPWDAWAALGWPGMALVVAVLALRRLPPVLLVYRFAPSLTARDAWFIGWFGPIGLTALLYAALVLERIADGELVWTVCSLLVFASVLVHGVTASLLAKLYGRKNHD